MYSKTSIEIINFVLELMYKEQYRRNGMFDGEIYGILVKEIKELDGEIYTLGKLNSTLKTLEKDNLVFSERKISQFTKKEKTFYFITIEGEMLIERGGYQEKINDIKSEKFKSNMQYWFNFWVAASSVTLMGVSIIDLFKKDEVRLLQNQSIEVKLGEKTIEKKDTCVDYRDYLKKK